MHRPGWIWAALPPDSRNVICLGNSGLADALRQAGLDVIACEDRRIAQPDAVLTDLGDRGAAKEAARMVAGTTGLAALAVGPSKSPSLRPVSRLARGLQMLVSPLTAISAEAAAKRLERTMANEGLSVFRVRTGDRSLPRYGLGPGGWVKRRRLPGGAIVIGARGPRRPAVLERAVSEAAQEVRRPLERLSAEVFPSGKLAADLADAEGGRYFLSITAGESEGLSRSETAIGAILGANPPPAVRERIVVPLATGRVGPTSYVLEPKVPGRHPIWMSTRLWRECITFLAHLHKLQDAAPPALQPAWPDLDTAVEILGRQADRDERTVLDRIRTEIGTRVAGLEGGVGHGDFFTKNLLIGGGSLRAVLDWEWAGRDSLPLLDLFDLRGQLGLRRRRGLRVGENFTDILWPLAKQGGDEPVREYCDAIGAPTDTHALEGLAMAHWLLRTARLGSINPRRLEHAGWWRANVAAPMELIASQGRKGTRER